MIKEMNLKNLPIKGKVSETHVACILSISDTLDH